MTKKTPVTTQITYDVSPEQLVRELIDSKCRENYLRGKIDGMKEGMNAMWQEERDRRRIDHEAIASIIAGAFDAIVGTEE